MKGNPNIHPCIDCDVLVAEVGSPALMHFGDLCLRAPHFGDLSACMLCYHAQAALCHQLQKRSVQQRTCQR